MGLSYHRIDKCKFARPLAACVDWLQEDEVACQNNRYSGIFGICGGLFFFECMGIPLILIISGVCTNLLPLVNKLWNAEYQMYMYN